MDIRSIIAAALLAALSSGAQAKQGDFLVRARAIIVAPNESTGGVNPTFPTGRLGVDDSFAPELDFTYFVTNHLGVELIAATTKHSATGRAALTGVGKIADTWVLPPTLTLQYHFAPQAKIRPYVGAGINYTIFYNSRAAKSLEDAIGSTKVGLSDSVGYAFQTGVDVDVTKRVFLNFDVKYINIESRAYLTTGALQNNVRVDLNPVVAGVGVGMRF